MSKKILLLLIALVACTYRFPDLNNTPHPGKADFTKVIAIGNSLTAGYANGALYDQGQQNSYANIIAGQINQVTPITFNQPEINAPVGYLGTDSSGTILGRLHLVNPQQPVPVPIVPGDPFDESYDGDKNQLNNFGVPGMRLVDVMKAGYALENPYYKRFALDINNGSVLDDALAAQASFFIFWLGNNDVLGYAISGASGNANGDGSQRDDLISADLFADTYQAVLDKLMAEKRQGVVINIPPVMEIPFFTTLSYNFIHFNTAEAADSALVAQLNQQYDAYNAGLLQAYNQGLLSEEEYNNRQILFADGDNGLVIEDEYLTDLNQAGLPDWRQTQAGDKLVLTVALLVGADYRQGAIGLAVPLTDEYVLTPPEQEVINSRIALYNQAIEQVASQYTEDLALVDIHAVFQDFLAHGVVINGSGLTPSIFPPFGAFSLDGVHPNPRGAAFVANQIIATLNDHFEAYIPPVNPNNYPGNELPVPQ